MDLTPWLLEIAALTGGYWLIDQGLRGGALDRILPTHIRLDVLVFAALGISWLTDWSALPQPDVLRVLAGLLSGMMAWKAATRDVDVVTGYDPRLERRILVAAAIGVWFEPAAVFVVAALLTRPFALWEHHATLPMRDLQATTAFVALSMMGLVHDTGALIWFLLVVHASHYLITALAKIYLGPMPWSWVTDNRLHHLAASAWSWGWARFIPWTQWRRFVGALKIGEVPMQGFAFGVELLAPFALLHPSMAITFCALWSAFHVGVFAASGLLFWDWIGANLALGIGLALLEGGTFGGWPLLAGLLMMVLFPLRHKLWKPMPLGWWDTPLTQRIRWQVVTEDGEIYGLYNDFMDPHARIYGKVHGCFLVPEPVCTYHLGEVYTRDLRDAIREAEPSLEGLVPVRERFGILPRDEALAENHRRYLRAFFTALNDGAKKHVLPPALRWLKAPGGQIFHWGALPRYHRQAPVTAVQLFFQEAIFDGEQIVVLRDDLIEEIPIVPLGLDEPAPREPTPKALDMFLLRFAKGKLIDLPGFADGLIGRDDGAP
ncbi:MAG: hypothetical protein AAFV53_27575 [Myxococcota bacterium]